MESIRRQLVVPPFVSAIHLAVGLALLAVGIALVAASPERPVAVAPNVEVGAASPEPVVAKTASSAPEASADAAPPSIYFVFRAGEETYMRLADAKRAKPKHGALRLVEHEGTYTALGAIAGDDVRPGHRAWLGRQVIVDGKCRATVTGFAIASQLVGSPGYAGVDRTTWDAATVMRLGKPMIAVRLDRCTGSFARDAAQSPVVFPELIDDVQLGATARSALFASRASQRMQDDYSTGEYDEHPGGHWWEHADVTTQIVRHPRTGATFVSVHAYQDGGCGGLTINVWGWFRVGADGTVSPVHVKRFKDPNFQDLHSIDGIYDFDDDGTFELIGRPWLGLDRVLAEVSGAEIDRVSAPFYGCPC